QSDAFCPRRDRGAGQPRGVAAVRAVVARVLQRAAERKLRVPAEYLGRMGETSFRGFLKFLLFFPLAAHRRKTDPSLLHAARIVATLHEDCGPCVQIAVNAALDDGMEAR